MQLSAEELALVLEGCQEQAVPEHVEDVSVLERVAALISRMSRLCKAS